MFPYHPLVLVLIVSAVLFGVMCLIGEVAFRLTRSRWKAKRPRGFEVKPVASDRPVVQEELK